MYSELIDLPIVSEKETNVDSFQKTSLDSTEVDLIEDKYEVHQVFDGETFKHVQGLKQIQPHYLNAVADLTGELANKSKIVFTPGMQQTNIAEMDIYKRRFSELSTAVKTSASEEIRLLAFLYVTNQPLKVFYTPDQPGGIAFDVFTPVKNPRETGEALFRKNLVSRKFFDKLHHCTSCGSHHLNVREECLSCRSADLTEVSIVHHYACAYQGPESDFIQGRDLVCPKCHQYLTHYGSDYERSGKALLCGSCGDTNSGAAVGFKCMDCEAHFDGEQLEAQAYYSYEILPAGEELLFRAPKGENFDVFAGLNFPMRIMQEMMRHRNGNSGNCNQLVVVELSYLSEKLLSDELGVAGFEELRGLVRENLRSTIRGDDMIEIGKDVDFIVFKNSSREQIVSRKRQIIEIAQNEIEYDLGLRAHVFDCEVFKT